MRRLVLMMLAAMLAACFAAPSAGADEGDEEEPDPPPCLQTSLQAVVANCSWTYADYSTTASSGDGHTWVVSIQCGNGGICTEHVECTENGETGFMHDVYMDSEDVGDVCVPESKVQEVDVRQLAIREFKRIDWASSKLKVQPPGGETLVNLDTIFYTTNAKPIPQTVTLAGRTVIIEATPTSYTWHFDDNTSASTSSPGHPYPNQDVVHVYEQTGDVEASVDTTYTGRFRIGDGQWQNIPDTLTVAGAAVDLTVLEAKPQLVIR